MCGHGVPVRPPSRRLLRQSQRLAEHHRVRSAGQRPRDLAAVLDLSAGDDVHVAATGFVQIVPAGGRGIDDGGGQRDPDAEHLVGGGEVIGADPDDDARRAGSHQVQRRLVVRAPADDHRHVEVGDELLEVQRFIAAAHVFRRHDRALDDEDVHTGGKDRRCQRQGVLRGDPNRRGHPAGGDLLDPRRDQVRPHRFGVDLLQQRRGRGIRIRVDDAGELRQRVVVPGPEPFGVEHSEPAQSTDLGDHGGAHRRVGGLRDERDPEAEGVDLPGRGHVVDVPRATGGDHSDVGQPVALAGAPSHADLGHQRAV